MRVALIGCGVAGQHHARAWVAHGCELVWAVDLEPRRAESLRALHPGAQMSADYGAVLRDDAVDAVDICLPHNLHAPVAVDAALAGKHVLCEKPLACTLKEADRMIAAADRGGVILMVAENVRFDPTYLRVQRLLQDGAIGTPALIQVTREAYLRRSFLEERQWFLDQESAAGGIMMSGGIHDLETMRMLLGPIDSIYALRARQRFHEMEGDDTSVAVVRFRSGAVGTLVESFILKNLATASGPEVHTLRVDGDDGSIAVQIGEPICLFSERAPWTSDLGLAEHRIHVAKGDTTLELVRAFCNSVHSGEEPVTSGRRQRRALELVLAAYRSMSLGAPVHLP